MGQFTNALFIKRFMGKWHRAKPNPAPQLLIKSSIKSPKSNPVIWLFRICNHFKLDKEFNKLRSFSLTLSILRRIGCLINPKFLSVQRLAMSRLYPIAI